MASKIPKVTPAPNSPAFRPQNNRTQNQNLIKQSGNSKLPRGQTRRGKTREIQKNHTWPEEKKKHSRIILAMSAPSIAVIGSLNIDFITRTPRVPGPGETLTSNSFSTGFGGKGANQAVACARLASEGTKVAMVGNVGDDNFGRDYFEALGKEGINADGVSTVKGETTGAANIIVEEEGENRIMFTPGANVAFSKEYDQGWDLVPSDAGIVVCQLEIPIDVVCFE
jgi:hypothetical protein